MEQSLNSPTVDSNYIYHSPWGYHLRVNCGNCDINAVTNPEIINQFVDTLVNKIDMKAFGDPQIFHFGEGDLAGWTLLQMIETSNINAHFIDHNGDAYIDVFSCKVFNPEDALEVIICYFTPKHINWTMDTRKAPRE